VGDEWDGVYGKERWGMDGELLVLMGRLGMAFTFGF
jgi:hypothetical protein